VDLPVDDKSIIDSLLALLHTPTNLGVTFETPFLRANDAFRNESQLMWPMLLKANSWLVARKELRTNWGESRAQDEPQSFGSYLISNAIQAFEFLGTVFVKK